MFVQVRTVEQEQAFQRTWEYFCRKYGWLNDPYAKNGVRYQLLAPRFRLIGTPKAAGTIEFTPFDPENPERSLHRFALHEHADLKEHLGRVWEIDKLCIHEMYQRQGFFLHFMPVFYDHALQHRPEYYVALIEKRLYRMLRISFGLHVEQRGEAVSGRNTVFVPMVFHIGGILQDQQLVDKFLAMSAAAIAEKNQVIAYGAVQQYRYWRGRINRASAKRWLKQLLKHVVR